MSTRQIVNDALEQAAEDIVREHAQESLLSLLTPPEIASSTTPIYCSPVIYSTAANLKEEKWEGSIYRRSCVSPPQLTRRERKDYSNLSSHMSRLAETREKHSNTAKKRTRVRQYPTSWIKYSRG